MSENLLSLLVLFSPVLFAATAVASWLQPGFKPKQVIAMSKAATILSMLLVAVSCFYVFEHGLIQSGLIGINGFGFSIRLDSVSMLMLGMISLLGFIIIKFSINYLDGHAEGAPGKLTPR